MCPARSGTRRLNKLDDTVSGQTGAQRHTYERSDFCARQTQSGCSAHRTWDIDYAIHDIVSRAHNTFEHRTVNTLLLAWGYGEAETDNLRIPWAGLLRN